MDTLGLNSEQKRAVQALDGPVLVSAAAGSGKTRVLTCRIARLIAEKKALPSQIMAVTFTNKAAREMKHRVTSLLHQMKAAFPPLPQAQKLWIGTFHSLCARILRDNPDHVPQSPGGLTIYDPKDQMSLVKDVLAEMNLSERLYNPKSLISQIALCKRQALDPQDLNESNHPGYGGRFQEIYQNYQSHLKNAGAFDFESLLFEAYKFFLKHPRKLESYRNQFRYISVDEYQDTNYIQYLLVKVLAEKHRNLCVVGDEDQSIYSWRGADISNILNFDRDFPECQIIKLEKNYRSTKTIISAASSLIGCNRQRKNKKLTTDNPLGGRIEVYALEDENQEASLIADHIARLCEGRGFAYGDFAVFYRTNAQSRVFEGALRSRGLPYQVVGSLQFYDRMEIKDVLAYLKFLSNPKDDVSLKRILNKPRRGIGPGSVEKITQWAREQKISFYEAFVGFIQNRGLKGPAARAGESFVSMVQELCQAKEKKSLSDFYTLVLERTGYAQELKTESSFEAQSRLDNLAELKNAISQYEMETPSASWEGFLEEMALLSPTPSPQEEDSKKGVSLMTLHVSKGLEFDVVFMVGMEDGLCPLLRTGSDSMEEERRLVYVGMTRARKNLFFTYAYKRHQYGKAHYNRPSPFLDEIPARFMQHKQSAARSPFGKRGFFKKKGEEGAGDFSDSSFSQAGDFSPPAYMVGQRVYHPQFGQGQIHKLEGAGEELRISVDFGHQNIKKFIARYARLVTENSY